MKKVILALLLIVVSTSIFSQESEVTKLYFIRHAEVDNDGTRDPKLSEMGRARAKKWATIFSSEKIDMVYTTDLARTRTTARSIMDKSKIGDISFYDPGTFELAPFLEKVKGKTVVVVGHSNTNPAFVNALIGVQKFGQMAGDDFGRLFVVTYFSKDKASVSVFNLQ